MQQLVNGTLLQGGKYRIEKVLGQGGFGITYLAEHTLLDKKVAIKEFFPKDFCDRNETTSHITLGTSSASELVAKLKLKFIKEAKNIAKLNHPNIVSIQDIFEENNTAYYLMSYVEGESLGDKLKRKGALSEQESIEYIRQIATAIEYMHSLSMNHLDIKPSNIMIRDVDNMPILIDFGTSKQYDNEGEQTSTMAPGFTHGYAPIEQYKPGGVSTFTPQTDIYALGATLFALLTGNKPPHYSEILEDGLPELPSNVSKSTREGIEHAMEIRKNKRPESIAIFLSHFDACDDNNVMSQETELNSESKNIIVGQNASHYEVANSLESDNLVEDNDCINLADETTEFISLTTDKKDNIYPLKETYVDLGLSVKWATCNIGAISPEDGGDYFAWGEINRKNAFSLENSKTYECEISNISGNSNYDVARANLGHPWRIPTKFEVEELINKCTFTWTTQGGRKGYKVTSKTNGNSIFIPAAGRKNGTILSFKEGQGSYWTDMPHEKDKRSAYCFYFGSKNYYIDWGYRDHGRTIRPVFD